MPELYLLDEPDPRLYVELAAYAISRMGRARIGDFKPDEIERFASLVGSDLTPDADKWVPLGGMDPEVVGRGIHAFVTSLDTPYPFVEICIDGGRSVFCVDYEDCWGAADAEALDSLRREGRFDSGSLRTAVAEALHSFMRTEIFINNLVAPEDQEEFDEVVREEFAYAPDPVTAEDAGAMICNAALILDPRGKVLGRFARARFVDRQFGGPEGLQELRWEAYAENWREQARDLLDRASAHDLQGLEAALVQRLREVVEQCRALETPPASAGRVAERW